MRGICAILMIIFGSSAVLANSNPANSSPIYAFLQTDETKADLSGYESFLTQLGKKRSHYAEDKDFLRHLFIKTHQKFLKTYQTESSFGEIFHAGKYNCLTGTALYALLLDHFRFNYTIIEVNYHIFIVVKLDGEELLIEATDPIEGFIEGSKKVTDQLKKYQNSTSFSDEKGTVKYEFSFTLWNAVSLEDLTGLLYFNKAVNAYNSKNIEQAVVFIIKAGEYGATPRIEEFSAILLLTIRESNLDIEEKNNLNHQLLVLQRKHESFSTAAVLSH